MGGWRGEMRGECMATHRSHSTRQLSRTVHTHARASLKVKEQWPTRMPCHTHTHTVDHDGRRMLTRHNVTPRKKQEGHGVAHLGVRWKLSVTQASGRFCLDLPNPHTP